MKERKSGLKNKSSKTKRTGLFQRITAAFPLPLIIIYNKVSSTFLPNLSLFWHINEGVPRRDYGRSCSPRNDPKFDLGLFEIVPFNRNQRCFLVSFLNKLKNLMDRTHPTKDIGTPKPERKKVELIARVPREKCKL